MASSSDPQEFPPRSLVEKSDHPLEGLSDYFSHQLSTSLEFLSCMKTDQIIPIQKINDVIIPALLNYLSKGKQHHLLDDISALFEKVHRDLVDINDTIKTLREWEDRLNTLTKSLILYDWEGFYCTERRKSVEDFQMALSDIDKMVSELKVHTSLPLETSSAELSNNSRPCCSSNLSIPNNEIPNLRLSEKFSETADDFQARYDNLNLQQRKCLLYFSVFPKGSLIRKKVLIYLWIGEGLIESTTAGDRLFEELIGKGFIEPVEEKDMGDFNACKINPLIRSALIMLARNEDFFDFDSHGNPTVDFTRSRRACLLKTTEGGSLQHLSAYENQEKLQMLFNVRESCLDFPSEWFSKTKNIVVLHLGNWSSSADNIIEAEDATFLAGLGDAKLLRCLSLNGISGIIELPGSIFKLNSNLMILDLKSCWNLEKLPNEIGLLTKLTHLDMSGCYLIDNMPKGLTSLSDLQVLKGFVIGGPRTKGQCTLSDLEKLEKLRKLGLYANRETTGEKGELNCLSKFRVLRILTISWTAVSSEPKSGKGVITVMHKILANMKKHDKADVPGPTQESSTTVGSREIQMTQMYAVLPQWPERLEKLTGTNTMTSVTTSSLPASLEKVDLRCWPSPRMPSWMKPWELNNLKKLYIRGGSLSDMQILQQEVCDLPKWTVKILRLKFLRELKMDWQALTTLFPSLVYLEKVDCPELLSFPTTEVWRRLG